MQKVILHSDLNNFYASVECLYNPEIRGKAVAVGGSVENRHGIILAKNYIAKKFNIKTGEAIWQAKQKCPQLIVVPPHYDLYLRFSKDAKDIYNHYSDQIESFGIDECWIDCSASTQVFGSGEKIANEIRRKIKDELGITASIGVSYNKIFAKLGSDMKKPDATTVITMENYKQSVWCLPVQDLLYVGRSTKKKLANIGILTIGELANSSIAFLKKYLGKWGEYLWYFANGLDTTPVTKLDQSNTIKGIGNSVTTPRDLTCNEDVRILLYILSGSVATRLRKYNFKGKTVQITLRDTNLNSIQRQGKLRTPTLISTEIAEKAYEIFLKNWNWENPIRSIGVRVTDLITADTCIQLSLFEESIKRSKCEDLEYCIDEIRGRFGYYAVQRALLLTDRKLNSNPAEENIIFPVSYFK